jgi:hypothetical protein
MRMAIERDAQRRILEHVANLLCARLVVYYAHLCVLERSSRNIDHTQAAMLKAELRSIGVTSARTDFAAFIHQYRLNTIARLC